MIRANWKGPYVNLKKLKTNTSQKPITVSRNTEIVPLFSGSTFTIHNGKKHINLKVTSEMIGYKFGEFVFTRANFVFKKSNKQK